MSSDHATASAGNERLQDRRDFLRLDKSGKGLLRLRKEAHPVGSGAIVDISANGLNLCCDAEWAERVTPGTPVEVVARLDETSEPFYLIGDVIWVRGLDDGQCQVGIELPPADESPDQSQHDNRDWRALFLA
ncbi:PilZ domain-containing protein [Guyparkeria hydrothermalis]|uniref:PilZ domain-containing protein n=1 Tax=Guyparkeria hydrothermalis TaxID=923 RepID=UPI00202015A8|nr:PilZ domain-containing protein [Guyparkeria hydrothermalis]MCL7743992.1 PilZ domain-containing protein [Guyparkeria hydrothermalis]